MHDEDVCENSLILAPAPYPRSCLGVTHCHAPACSCALAQLCDCAPRRATTVQSPRNQPCSSSSNSSSSMRPTFGDSSVRPSQVLARVGIDEDVSLSTGSSRQAQRAAAASPPTTPQHQASVKPPAPAAAVKESMSGFSRVKGFFRKMFSTSSDSKLSDNDKDSAASRPQLQQASPPPVAAPSGTFGHPDLTVNIAGGSDLSPKLRPQPGGGQLTSQASSTSLRPPAVTLPCSPTESCKQLSSSCVMQSPDYQHVYPTSLAMSEKNLARFNSSPLGSPTMPFMPVPTTPTAACPSPAAPTSPQAASPTAPQGLSPTFRKDSISQTRMSSKGEGSVHSRQPKMEATKLLAISPTLPPNMARPVWNMKDYAVTKKLYTGYASTVYKATCKASGETVCLKAYNMANVCDLNRHQIYREIRLHSKLQHENVITLYGAFQQGEHVVMVQEYAEAGDLFHLLHRHGGKLSEKAAVEVVLHPFLLVLNHLHQNCVMHRDIKPENLLFTRSMQLKLADFGLALDMREERAVTRAGTLEYMAPEVLNCPFKTRPDENKGNTNLYYELSVDTWAVGVLAYELLVGFPPFNDKQRALIEDKIRMDAPRFPSRMSEGARTFILESLNKDALERPTIMELLSHPWIRAHRRNASMRSLTPRGHKQLSFEEVDEDRGLQAPAAASPVGAGPAKGFSRDSEMRTVDGDLLKPAKAFMSFTAGTNRPRAALQLSQETRPYPGSKHIPMPFPSAHQAQFPSTHQVQFPSAHQVPSPSAGAPEVTPMLKSARNIAAGLSELKSGMSFSSAHNPKMQAFKKLAAQ